MTSIVIEPTQHPRVGLVGVACALLTCHVLAFGVSPARAAEPSPPMARPTSAPAPSPTSAPNRTSEVTRVLVGRSVAGRKIVALRKGDRRATRRVVLLGQMHGTEPAGVTTARAAARLSVRTDTVVWIIPTMNPDGHRKGSRTNARGVDLNRNWPMNWRRTARGQTYSGPRAASEPETRAMMRFLRKARPTHVVSLHQPFATVGLAREKPRGFQRRLARALGLPLGSIGIGGPKPRPMSAKKEKAKGYQPGSGANLPTLTGWFNAHQPGTAVTVEFARRPESRFLRRTAPRAILEVTGVR